MAKLVIEFLFEALSLPEILIATLCPNGIDIVYLKSYDKERFNQCEWTRYRENAYLFYDIDEVKEKFPLYDGDSYLAICYSDFWSNKELYKELIC